jgi:hypothetical protein
MAQPGHADDCPACRYNELPAADKAALDASAFSTHTRQSPPVEPLDSNRGMGLLVGGAFVLLLSLVTALLHPAIPPAIALLGGTMLVAGVVARSRFRRELGAARMQWRRTFDAWKAEQTRVWLQHRSRADLWPCPTCGDLSCSNQHSSTRTYRKGPRRFDSFTDPR